MSKNVDKNLLIKLYDFNPYDESVFNSDNNNNNFKCNKEYVVQLFGISERGYTASIYVKNYKPCFYVKIPDIWDEQLKNEFISHMRKKMGLYYEESILNSYLIKKHKLYGFDNFKLHNFIYIEFSCVQALNKAKKIFYKETIIGNFYEKKLIEEGYKFLDYYVFLYEAQIPPLLKLFHIKEISPSGWILCCAKKIKHIYNKKTYAHYEFEIDYKDIISKPEKETSVKYNICSFDIEASSSHGDFPVAIKDYKKLAIDIITYYNTLEDKSLFTNELLKKCVLSSFHTDSINDYNINIVYPKESINIQNIEKALENIIKINIKSIKNTDGDFLISDSESDSQSESDDELLDNNFKPKSKKNKKYSKDATILELILDNKCDVNIKIKYLNNILSNYLPELKGDIVTFIGLSFLYYGDSKSYKKILLVKDGCKPPDDYDLEKNVTKIIVCNTEKDLLLKFAKIIQLKQPHMIIGYNINGFDFEFMYERSKELECSEEFLKLSYNKNEICYNKDWKTGKFDIEKSKIFLASGEYNLKYIKMPGRIIIDLYNVFRRDYVLTSYKLDYTSSYFISDSVKKYEILDDNTTKIYSSNLTGLNELAYVKFEEIGYSVNYYKQGTKFKIIKINDHEKSFIIDSKEEFDITNQKVNWGLAKDDISPAEIFKLSMGSDEDRWLVGKYCLADCDNVLELLLKNDIITSCIEMSNLCSVPFNYLLIRGQGIKLTSYVCKKCSEKNILTPVIEKSTDNSGYEGAHVLSPKTGLYLEDPVSCLDYSSLYPSSIISENISHDSKVWTKEYDLSNNLLKETGEKDQYNNYIYDNLPKYKYVDIKYDTYKYVRSTSKSAAKKVIVGYKICRFAQFPDNKLAVLPAILQELLYARKATRKLIKTQNDEFMKNVLDKRQLTIKTAANSVYGQAGAKTSTFYEKDIAASTTAVGRMLLSYAKNIVEECYHNYEKKMSDDNDVIINADCIYGDSVTNYTPIYVRINSNTIGVYTIEELSNKFGQTQEWKYFTENGKETKMYMNIKDNILLETWTNNNWTKLDRIIKHKLAEGKNIFRILTHTGLVDVTDDHSLLKNDESIISPNEIEIGTELLHNTLNIEQYIFDNNNDSISLMKSKISGFFFGDGSCGIYNCPSGIKYSWALNNKNIDLLKYYKNLCEIVYPQFEWLIYDTIKSSNVYKLSFSGKNKNQFIIDYRKNHYYNKSKIIPSCILNSSKNIRQEFWDGLYDADGDKDKKGYTRIDQKSQISAANICLLANSLDYKTSINIRKDKLDVYRITCTKNNQRKSGDKVKKIVNITKHVVSDNNTYVYDLTTCNHHFCAGIGNMIVHNTDSVFVKFDFTNKKDNTKIKNKKALEYSIEIAQEAGELASKFLKHPHDLEYEKTFWPFCLLSKKRYDGMLYEFDPNKCKLKSMGNVLKRRDNAPIVKDIYGGVINILMKDKDLNKAIKFVDNSLQNIKDEKYNINKLVITKSLRSYYKNPNQIAHNVLANRIGNRDTKPGPGDRINYAYIVNSDKKALQGNKIETPQFIIDNNLKIDYNFYITNQIMKPLQQLFSLELENMVEFKKKRGHTLNSWNNEINKLKEKWVDHDKFNKKYEELRCKEVKALIFDKYLN